MVRWKPILTSEAGHRDSDRAWMVSVVDELSRKEVNVRVDVAAGRLDELHLPECRRAVITNGRSALEPYLKDERLPKQLVISSDGIHAAYG